MASTEMAPHWLDGLYELGMDAQQVIDRLAQSPQLRRAISAGVQAERETDERRQQPGWVGPQVGQVMRQRILAALQAP
jgi:hypothetical protein